MKIAVLVARILLGLVFLVFGLNGFLNFLHAPIPPGPAGQYLVSARPHHLHEIRLPGADCWRGAAAFWPVHPAGVDPARAGHRQHPPLPHLPAACRFAPWTAHRRSMVHHLFWGATGVRRRFRAESGDLRKAVRQGLKCLRENERHGRSLLSSRPRGPTAKREPSP